MTKLDLMDPILPTVGKNKTQKKALDFSKAFCALEGSRTPNLLIRSQVLYPIKLRMHFPYRLRECKSNI
jgi:hypothetical protein